MLFITYGEPEPISSVAVAEQNPIVTKMSPFAPPLDVSTYGINIALEDTQYTQRVVNSGTTVPVVTTADPDLYYDILVRRDRAVG